MTSQEGVGLSIRHGLDENQAPVIKETPVLLNSSSPTPNMGNSVSIATNMLSSNPTPSVGPGATLAGTPIIVTPTTTTTNNATQPEVADIEMAPLDQTAGAHRSTTDEASSLVWSTLSAAIQPPTEAVSQKQQEQSEDVSQSSLLPSPPRRYLLYQALSLRRQLLDFRRRRNLICGINVSSTLISYRP